MSSEHKVWLDAQRRPGFGIPVIVSMQNRLQLVSMVEGMVSPADCALCSWIAGTKATASFSTHRRNSNANVPMKKEKEF